MAAKTTYLIRYLRSILLYRVVAGGVRTSSGK